MRSQQKQTYARTSKRERPRPEQLQPDSSSALQAAPDTSSAYFSVVDSCDLVAAPLHLLAPTGCLLYLLVQHEQPRICDSRESELAVSYWNSGLPKDLLLSLLMSLRLGYACVWGSCTIEVLLGEMTAQCICTTTGSVTQPSLLPRFTLGSSLQSASVAVARQSTEACASSIWAWPTIVNTFHRSHMGKCRAQSEIFCNGTSLWIYFVPKPKTHILCTNDGTDVWPLWLWRTVRCIAYEFVKQCYHSDCSKDCTDCTAAVDTKHLESWWRKMPKLLELYDDMLAPPSTSTDCPDAHTRAVEAAISASLAHQPSGPYWTTLYDGHAGLPRGREGLKLDTITSTWKRWSTGPGPVPPWLHQMLHSVVSQQSKCSCMCALLSCVSSAAPVPAREELEEALSLRGLVVSEWSTVHSVSSVVRNRMAVFPPVWSTSNGSCSSTSGSDILKLHPDGTCVCVSLAPASKLHH